MIRTQPRNVNMLCGPILPQMLRFSLPLMATYLMDIIFFAADKMVAGQCAGSGALAAVSACGPVLNLLVALFNGLAVGATVAVARHIGAKNPLATEQAVHTAACLGAVVCVFLFVVGTVLCAPMLRMLRTPEDIFDDACTYFRIRIIGLSLDIIYKFSAGTLRAAGQTQKPLVFSAIAGILNVGLNFLLVAGLHMGVAGLAVATDVSNLTCVVCVLLFQLRTEGPCRLYPARLRMDKRAVWDIIRIGLPAGIQSACFSISNAFIQSAINSLGTGAIAGVAAASTYSGVSDAVVQAADHAATTFASQNYGAKQLGRIWRIVGACIVMAAIILLPVVAVFVLFGQPLLSVFVPQSDPNFADAISCGMMHIYMLDGFKLVYVAMVSGSSVLRGLQKPWLPMFAVLVGTVILRVMWIAFVFPLHPSALMIFICYPITWFMTAVFNFAALRIVMKKYQSSPLLPTT